MLAQYIVPTHLWVHNIQKKAVDGKTNFAFLSFFDVKSDYGFALRRVGTVAATDGKQ